MRLRLLRVHRREWHVALNLQFEPHDIWVGLFWRARMSYEENLFADGRGGVVWRLHAYLCMLPMVPVHLMVWRTWR